MLIGLGLTNFKAFSNLPRLGLKPITVVCGTNSCGKSTLLQSALMLKQTFESRSANQRLLLNGKYVRLGSLENIIYRKNLNSHVGFDLEFAVRPAHANRPTSDRRAPLRAYLREWLPEFPDHPSARVHHHLVRLKVTLAAAKRTRARLVSRPSVIKKYSMSVATEMQDGAIIEGARVALEHLEGSLYNIEWSRWNQRLGGIAPTPRGLEPNGSTRAGVTFTNLTPQAMLGASPEEHGRAMSILFRIAPIVQALFDSFSYLGPLREEPSRRYIYEDEVMEIGTKGENSAYLFLDQCKAELSNHYFLDTSSDEFVRENSVTLEKAVARWFSVFGVSGFTPENKGDIIQVSLNASKTSTTKVTIADVGFGVSQIFPVVLEGLRLRRGGTLMLEQPEIHLHPKLQGQLADYVISLALSEKNVFLETHSDHVINRLVRRILEDPTDRLADTIGIYFVTPGPEGSEVREVQIDPTMGIVDWPKDFFDQSAEESERLIRAGLAKRRVRRRGNELSRS